MCLFKCLHMFMCSCCYFYMWPVIFVVLVYLHLLSESFPFLFNFLLLLFFLSFLFGSKRECVILCFSFWFRCCCCSFIKSAWNLHKIKCWKLFLYFLRYFSLLLAFILTKFSPKQMTEILKYIICFNTLHFPNKKEIEVIILRNKC